jgi:hypothetical protein
VGTPAQPEPRQPGPPKLAIDEDWMIGENPVKRVAKRSSATRMWLAVVYTGGRCARGASN